MKSLLLVAALCIALSLAEFDVHESFYIREGVPANSGWSILRKAESSHKVEFTISLQQQNLDQLEARFWANADPKSPVYAQHMTRAEVTALTAPSLKVQKQVLRWINRVAESLPKGNVFEINNQQDAIVIKSTALFAEKLFRAEMFLFHNDRNNMITCKHLGQLSIPVEVKEHITFISGITELVPIAPKKVEKQKPVTSSRQVADNQCNTAYSIKNLYNVPTNLYITEKGSNASVYASVIAASDDSFGLESVVDYQVANGLPKNPISCIIGNGDQDFIQNDTQANEANLDVQMVTGMAPNVDTCFYLMDADNGWMYEFTRYIFNTPDAPLVVSMSYGWNENMQCSNLTGGFQLGNCTYYNIPDNQQYVNLTNINFQKLGLVGHTILACSGDDGIAGMHGTMDNCATQAPIFPACSPYVTSVGATSVEESASPSPNQKKTGQPPVCTDQNYQCICSTSNNEQPALNNNTAQFDTGGGFSMFSPQPAYQQSAVQAYLNSGVVLPPSQYFNKNNRGYPDIAAVGENICLISGSEQPCQLIGGTSASTPIMGGIVALLNNDRLAAGKTPLGFINPVIYDMFDADPIKYFNNQIEYGNNAGECPSDMGFNSRSGHWTPLTGVGSPNFNTIRAYVAQLK